MRVKGDQLHSAMRFYSGILGTACCLLCGLKLLLLMLCRCLASRVVASFADSNCSKAGAQVAPNSVLAQSRVKSSRLLKACLAAAAAFASACLTASAIHFSFLLFKTYVYQSFNAWQCIHCAGRP